MHKVFAFSAGGTGFDSRLRRISLGCSVQRMLMTLVKPLHLENFRSYFINFCQLHFYCIRIHESQKSGSIGSGIPSQKAYDMIAIERWKYDERHGIEDDIPYLALLSMAALSLSGMLSLGETSNLMVCRQDQVSHVQICTITDLHLLQKTG
jgi:hypothetical protein